MNEHDAYMIEEFDAPAALFESAAAKVTGAVHSAEHAVGEAADRVVAVLKAAGQIAVALGKDVEGLVVELGKWADGCVGVVTTAIASAGALGGAIAVFIAGIPADMTAVGSVIGVPAQAAAMAGAIASSAVLLASIAAVIECKQLKGLVRQM